MSPEIGGYSGISDSEFKSLTEKRLPTPIPQISIDLVNRASSEAFPDQFGTTIPVLRAEDVYVLSDRDILNFQHSTASKEMHPYLLESYRMEDEELGISSDLQAQFGKKESQAMIQVLPIVGLPILYPVSDLLVDNKAVVEPGTAKTLLHENFHRTVVLQKPHPIKPDDPLFNLAFSHQRIRKNVQMDSNTRKAFARHYRRLVDFAASHNPHVVTEGARAILFCEDDGGKLRRFVESGYDLNEGIVERLAFHSLLPIADYVSDHYGSDFSRRWREFQFKLAGTDSTYRFNNTLIGIDSYLRKLKIRSMEDLLVAFSESNIPRLHSLHSKAEYVA